MLYVSTHSLPTTNSPTRPARLGRQRQRFVPATEAAMLVGYNSERVTALARAGKIVAEERDGHWYVLPNALKTFMLEQTTRQQKQQAVSRVQQWRVYVIKTLTAQIEQQNARQTKDKVWAAMGALTITGSVLLLIWIIGAAVLGG